MEKTTEYCIEASLNGKKFYYKKVSGWTRFDFDDNSERANRWKTEAGASKVLSELLSFIAGLDKHYRHWYEDYKNIKVVETATLPPPKFCKIKINKEDLGVLRKEILSTLLSNGWQPNMAYTGGRYKAIEDDGTGHLIDSDGHYAIRLKPTVLTVYDASREFCKVLSMEYKETTIVGKELICGRIALKMG